MTISRVIEEHGSHQAYNATISLACVLFTIL